MKAPELILHNGAITTLEDRLPQASTISIAAGRIMAIGGEELLKNAGKTTKRIDLKGRRVIPGLNDSHIHVIRGGLNFNMELRWDGVPSLATALEMLREQARRTPPPQWVRVIGGWTEFQFAEQRMPTLEEINAGRPRHAGVRPAPVRPGHRQPGGAAGAGLHAGDPRSARRGDPARQGGESDRAPDRQAECPDPLRQPGQGAEARL